MKVCKGEYAQLLFVFYICLEIIRDMGFLSGQEISTLCLSTPPFLREKYCRQVCLFSLSSRETEAGRFQDWVLARIWTWKIWLISRPMLNLQTTSHSFCNAVFCNKARSFYTITYAVQNSSLCAWRCLFSMAFGGALCLLDLCSSKDADCSWQISHLFLFSCCLKGTAVFCSGPLCSIRNSFTVSSRLQQALAGCGVHPSPS